MGVEVFTQSVCSIHAKLLRVKCLFITNKIKCLLKCLFITQRACLPYIKPGFHMIAMRSLQSYRNLSSNRSDNDRWDRTFCISAIVVAAIVWKVVSLGRYDRWTFFSQRSQRSYGSRYERPCVNKDFFHDDVFSCVFRLFSLVLSTQKSTAMMKNLLAFLELNV